MESLVSEITAAAGQIQIGVLPFAVTVIALLAVLSGLAARVAQHVEDYQLRTAGHSQEAPNCNNPGDLRPRDLS